MQPTKSARVTVAYADPRPPHERRERTTEVPNENKEAAVLAATSLLRVELGFARPKLEVLGVSVAWLD